MKNKKVYTYILSSILIFLVLIRLGSVIWEQRVKYLSSDYWERFSQLEQIYKDSQYVNKHPKGFVPDEVVFAYAGGAYVQGINPVLVIPDAPPLGKYLIGLSTLLFHNEHILALVSGIGSLILLYLVCLQIFSSKTISLIPVVLYSYEPIFRNQFVYTPLFDTTQLAFLSLAFFFFNKGFLKKHFVLFFLLANVFIGCFIATKFFISGVTIIAAGFFTIILHKKVKQAGAFIASASVAVLILLVSYARVFAFGYDLRHFLGIQKWVFLYHQSQIILSFSVWPLLLMNKWYVWWGDVPIISDAQWTVLWPVITLSSFLTIVLYIKRAIVWKPELEVIMCWVVFYLLFLSVGQITTRYFIILLPFLYIISVYGIQQIVCSLLKKKKICI